MIMLSSIFPNFRKFKTSVMDYVPNILKLQKLCKSDFSYTRFWYYSRVELLCNFPREEFIWLSTAHEFLMAAVDMNWLPIHVNCSHHWIMICKGWIYQRYQEPSPQFVLEESSMRMICISGSTSNADNHIIDTNRMDLNDIPHEKINRCLTGINLCLTDIFKI